jgi:uncharacterized protein (TIGR03435 family)
MRKYACALLVVAALQITNAQSPQATPGPRPLAFEVSSVKVNTSIGAGGGITGTINSGRFVATNVPLAFVLRSTYGIDADYQLVGAADWVNTTKYDFVGTYPPGLKPDLDQLHEMTKELLRRRFGLKTHDEMREVAAYSLVLARPDGRLGERLKPSDVDCAKWLAEGRGQITFDGPGGARQVHCLVLSSQNTITGAGRPLSFLANALRIATHRPVFDDTGLTGAFDLDLAWSQLVDFTRSDAGDPGTGGSIFTALQEQLGLKLEPARRQIPVVVIDEIRRADPD